VRGAAERAGAGPRQGGGGAQLRLGGAAAARARLGRAARAVPRRTAVGVGAARKQALVAQASACARASGGAWACSKEKRLAGAGAARAQARVSPRKSDARARQAGGKPGDAGRLDWSADTGSRRGCGSGRSERVTNNGRRRKSYAGQRCAERRRAAHDGVPVGRAQAATELVCRRVVRDGHLRPSRKTQRKARP
jgi:hypothetical protein